MTNPDRHTPEDLAGTSEVGRGAYQKRIRELRRMGLRLPPGVDQLPAERELAELYNNSWIRDDDGPVH